jgi:hypothetical protein
VRRNSDDILVITAGAPRGGIGALCRLGGRACLGGALSHLGGKKRLGGAGLDLGSLMNTFRPAPTGSCWRGPQLT